MEVLIQEITGNASRVLLNPFPLTGALIGILAIVSGAAARGAMLLEDLIEARR